MSEMSEKERLALQRHGQRVRKRGIFLCGYEKLTPREEALFVEFVLSLDSENADENN